MLKAFSLVSAATLSPATPGKMVNAVAPERMSEDRDLPSTVFCYFNGLWNEPSIETMCLVRWKAHITAK